MINALHAQSNAISRCFDVAARRIVELEGRSADVCDFALLTYSGQDQAERFIAPTAHQSALMLIESILALMLPTRLEQYTDEFILDEVENGLDVFALDVIETQRLLARMQRECLLLSSTEPAMSVGQDDFLVTVEDVSLATAGADGLPRVSVKAIRDRLSVMPGGRPTPRDSGPPEVYAYADWHTWWKGAGFKICNELPSETDARRLVRVGSSRLCSMLRGQ
jgi:hypothetical protein